MVVGRSGDFPDGLSTSEGDEASGVYLPSEYNAHFVLRAR